VDAERFTPSLCDQGFPASRIRRKGSTPAHAREYVAATGRARAFTLTVYGHLFDEDLDALAENLDRQRAI
jgi:hypothetical protein